MTRPMLTGAALVVAAIAMGMALAPTGQAQIEDCQTISQPGTYQLNTSFTANTSDDCLVIEADDVELAGGKHTINGTEADSGAHGLFVDGASNVTIGNLTLASFPGDGIHVTSSDNVTIDNATTTHSAHGVTLATVDDSLLQASTSSHNTGYGINLSGTNLDNDVYGTVIEANDQAGIFVSNDTGGTEVADNRFNNTNNAKFEANPLPNAWNVPVSSEENVLGFSAYGGNYWATPAGDGFSETCTDADLNGYCDSPYALAASNQDGTPLAPLGTLTGTLTDTNGDPVDGVTVNVFDQATGNGAAATSDAQGVYELALPPGSYGIDLRPSEYGDVSAHGLDVSFEQTTTHDVELAPTGTLNVKVEDGDGAAVGNASLETFDDGKTTFQQTTADAQGNASFDVAAGTYTIVADANRYGQTVREGLEVPADGAQNVTVTLQAGAYINGTVDDQAGNPVQAATVLADDGDRFSFAKTDANGDYSLEVAPGSYNVMVFHAAGGQQSYARADGSITLASGDETTLNLTLKQPTVTNETVRILDGPGVGSALGADVSVMQGLLGIRVIDKANATQGMPSDLEPVNVNASTEFEINFTVEDYDPQALLWGGANVSWSTSPHPSNANATNVSIRTTPVHLAGIDPKTSTQPGPLMGQNPETVSWPTGSADKASSQYDWNQTVFLTLFDLSTVPTDRADLLKDMTVTTNAQTFSIPQVKDDRLRVWVAGPATTSTGADHDGFYRAFIPDAQLDEWGISDPASELSALYKGESASFSVNETDDGAWIDMDIGYSAGSVDIEPDVSTSSSGGGGGGGPPTAREGWTVDTRPNVDFDAEPGGTVIVDDWMPEGLDQVEVTFEEACDDCEITLETADERPTAAQPLAGVDEAHHWTIDVLDADDDPADVVDEATVTFTLPAATLDDAAPDQVVLLRDGGGGWQPLATEPVEDEETAFEARTPGFSAFAAAVDETPPTVEVRQPAPGTGPSTVQTLAANLSDNVAIDEAATKLWLDGTQVASAVSPEGRIVHVAEDPLEPGEHTAKVEVTDTAGHTTTETWTFHAACERQATVTWPDSPEGTVVAEIEAGTCPVEAAHLAVAGTTLAATAQIQPGQARELTADLAAIDELGANPVALVTAEDAAGEQIEAASHVDVDPVEEPADAEDTGEDRQPDEAPGLGLVSVLAAMAAVTATRRCQT